MVTAMEMRTFDLEVIAGEGAVADIGAVLHRLGVRRAAVCAGAAAGVGRCAADLRHALGDRLVAWLPPTDNHPIGADIDARAAIAVARDVDVVIGVGGASALDTAKAVSLVLARGGSIEDHCRQPLPDEPRPPAGRVPVVAIPSTASGAEVSHGGGIIVADGAKRVFWDPSPGPRVVVLDHRATREPPVATLVATAFTGIAHCMEALYARERTPLADAMAVQGLRHFAHGLHAIVRDHTDGEGHRHLQFASVCGGLAMVNGRLCAHHALCHGVASPFGVLHGHAHAVMLTHVIRWNAPWAATEMADIAQALGIDRADTRLPAEQIVGWLNEIAAALGAPRSLRALGIERTALGGVAADVFAHARLDANPRPVDAATDLLDVLHAAW